MDNSENKLAWTGERLVTELINHEASLDHLHRYARARELAVGLDVLDIASGEGYGSNLLAQVARSVVGVDIAQEAVDFANSKYKRSNLTFRQGSASAMPLPDASVDIIVSFETLEHHHLHDEMFLEIKRVLRPNGVLIMSSPEKSTYQELDPDNPFHVKELNLAEFRTLIEKYFGHYKMLYQRYLEASVLTVENEVGALVEYTGDFDSIESTVGLKKWYYNICIASDAELQPVAPSVFRRKDAPASPWAVAWENEQKKGRKLQEQIQSIYDSRTYRIGRLVTAPLRFLKKDSSGK